MPKPSNRRQTELDLQDAQAQLAAAHARVSDLLAASESLAGRVQELEAELEAVGLEEAGLEEADVVASANESEREALLARRVAELEAARANGAGVERDTDAVAAHARELAERVQSLQLQLESARSREDELTARTVHADGLLADLGLRLADLGTQADRAEQLSVDLERVREESAFALAVARDDAAATREELDGVRVDLGAALADAEGRIAELDAAHGAASERAGAAEARADEAELRASILESELVAATGILESLEQVYTAVRDRVEASAGHDDVSGGPGGLTPPQTQLQAQLEAAILRVQGLEQELQESVAVLRDQVRDLADRVSDAEAGGHHDPEPLASEPIETAGLEEAPAVADVLMAEPAPEEDFFVDVANAPAPSPVHYLSVTDLLAIGERELGLGTAVDLAALEAVASLPCALDDGHERFPGVHVKAAALLAETLAREPFAHGNDRVALMTVVVFLSMNGYGIDAPEEDLAELTRIVSEGELPLLHIAAALEAASSPLPAGMGELRMEG